MPRSFARCTGLAFAMFVLGGFLATAHAAVGDAVRMAPASPGAVRFTVTVPAAKWSEQDAGEKLLRPELNGFALVGEGAGPALPVRIVSVAVPPLGEVRVNAVASELLVRDGVLLAPQAPLTEGEPLARDLARYETDGSATPVAARLVDVSWMRNQRIARIAIEPASYEPRARRFSLAGRIDVDVQVQPMGSLGEPAEPVDAFEPVYRQALLNYEQGKTWRRPATSVLLAAARRMNLDPARSLGVGPPVVSTFAGHQWIKFGVKQTGFYTVDYSSVRNLGAFSTAEAAIAFDALRLVTLPGYPIIPQDSYCDTCDYQQVAIGTFDTSDPAGPFHSAADGNFSYNDDYLYFFAQGPNGWGTDYDPSRADTLYLDHPYETQNYYFLTFVAPDDNRLGAPRRIAHANHAVVGGSGATVVSTARERLHIERDLIYVPDASARGSSLFWEKWFWSQMTPGGSVPVSVDLAHADSSQPARFRMRQWGITDNSSNCGLYPDHLLQVSINSLTLGQRAWNSFYAQRGGQMTIDTTGTFLVQGTNNIVVSVPVLAATGCPKRVDKSALAWLELYYARFLQPDNDVLEFRSPAAAGNYHYDVGPFRRSRQARLFDVTDPLAPVEADAVSWDSTGAGWVMRFEASQTGERRFYALPDTLVSLARLDRTQISEAPNTSLENLRESTNGADYLVIYYDAFQSAANALAEARTTRLPIVGSGPFLAKAIPVSALYDQFSGGRTDPAAIRNFLRAAFYNWSKVPKFVTFLGDASYDFKNISSRAGPGQPGCLLPTFEDGFDSSNSLLRQFVSDDWLLNVDQASVTTFIPDFFGGRLPANDAAGALDVVKQKILAYERSAPFGEYRNEVMLIADNELQGENCDIIGWGHIAQTDELNVHHTPLHIDRDYVYLHTYAEGPGGTRPGARADIRKYLDRGIAMFNYVGHGSPFKLSDESVFIDSDAAILANGMRMPVFVAASCDVGKFSDPTVQSLGERLVMTTGAGCVAVISATEQAFSGYNASLNQALYDALFERYDIVAGPDTLHGAGQYHAALSAALLAAKLNAPFSSPINNSKYQLMGDAATVLNLPRLWADVTLTDAGGAPVTQLQRGQRLHFQGRVLDAPAGAAMPFDGVASVLIEDSAPTANTGVTEGCNYLGSTIYRYSAGTVFHGDVSVANGVFEGQFVVPMDATLGAEGRVRSYLSGQSGATVSTIDGAGALQTEIVTGTANPLDTDPPRVTLSFVGGSVTVRPDATLQVDLFDQSGIMTTGHALQNSIVVTIDDNTTSRVDITPSFRYASDSYQQGTASYQLPGLANGHHKIRVSAADNLATGITASQHRGSATLEFDVVETPRLSITRAYLFPNPVSSKGAGAGGTFVVDAPGDSVNTLIKVYTVTGRMILSLTHRGALGQVQIPWDGRDADGDPLANGTYLFKVYVNGREADGTSSARTKAAAEGRFVILNR